MLLFLLSLLSGTANCVCIDPTTLTPPSSPSTYTFDIGGSDYSFTIDAWTQGVDCNFSETLTFSPDLSTLAWISELSRTVTISTSDLSLHGTSTTFTVTSTVDDSNNTNNNGYTFEIVLNNPCILTALNPPSSPSLYTFNIGDSDYSWTIPAWTQNPVCSYTETLTFSPLLSGISWISELSRSITISASDISLHNTSQTFTVTSTTNDNASSSNSGYTFQIKLINPCTTTTLTPPASPSSYSFDIGGSDYSFNIAAWTQ